mmetsp:Transcript_90741/g.203031  ORF Transcript_90741/g.203031 Transcript_90741/m.203031 type:complete len:113 (+) Transcript_90741:46-384(+)
MGPSRTLQRKEPHPPRVEANPPVPPRHSVAILRLGVPQSTVEAFWIWIFCRATLLLEAVDASESIATLVWQSTVLLISDSDQVAPLAGTPLPLAGLAGRAAAFGRTDDLGLL